MGGERAKRDVQAYVTKRDEWGALPSLPEEVKSSAAVLLGGEYLYNIGGFGSSTSVLLLNVGSGSSQWRAVEVKGAVFSLWFFRDAASLMDKIIYFGSTAEKESFVLKREEDALVVEGRHSCIDYSHNISYTPSFRCYKGQLYAFDNHGSVYCFTLDTHEWKKSSL